MSRPGKAPVSHGLAPVDVRSAKEPLPPQTVVKIFSISIIAQGLPFCRRRVSLWHGRMSVCLRAVSLPVKHCFRSRVFVRKASSAPCSQGKLAQPER